MSLKGTIKNIVLQNEWKSTNGIVYYQEYTIDTAEEGVVIGVLGTKDKSKYKIGDEIEFNYTNTSDKQGNMYKKLIPVNPEQNNFYQNKFKDKQHSRLDNVGMMVGNALSNATVLVANNVISLDELESIAERICEISEKLKTKFSN